MSTESGETAIVTGAARGIGRAIAERLCAGGWTVVVADREADTAAATVDALRTAGMAAVSCAVDVTDTVAVEETVEAIVAEHGGIDVLVNNAGVLRDAPLTDMTDEDFGLVLDVCLTGSFRMSRAVAPTMIERGSGRVVNIASRAYLGNPGQANYSAAKAGLVGLTKALAKELGRHSITVNAVAPGMVDSDMIRKHPKAEAIVARAIKANSVPRIGELEDVAAAVAYLCSPEAGYVTGDVLHVSGGRFG